MTTQILKKPKLSKFKSVMRGKRKNLCRLLNGKKLNSILNDLATLADPKAEEMLKKQLATEYNMKQLFAVCMSLIMDGHLSKRDEEIIGAMTFSIGNMMLNKHFDKGNTSVMANRIIKSLHNNIMNVELGDTTRYGQKFNKS